MPDMPDLIVRPLREADLAAVEAMVDLFAAGHPASRHPRSRETLRSAYLGPDRVAEMLVVDHAGSIVGMGQWRRIYDLFWDMLGAEAEWLFVMPDRRGHGIAAAIIAAICARAIGAGCAFLHGHAGEEDVARLYARIAIESPGWSFFLSAAAFRAMAALDGLSPREIVRRLPDHALNGVA